MRVVLLLDDLMKELDLDDSDIHRMFGIHPRTVEKLRTDSDEWRLSRTNLHKLMLFAFDHGYPNGIFELRLHPLWDDFRQGPVAIFREQLAWDTKVEEHLRGFFSHFRDDPQTETQALISVDDVADVERAMKNCNCIFVGSPKSSIATEIALSLLWDAKPLDASDENRSRLPVQFHGMRHSRPESAMLVDSDQHGLRIHDPKKKKPVHVSVDWFPLDTYMPYIGEGWDASLAVVCRQPFGTEEPVTTVVVSGYTGRATLLTTEELTHGEPPLSLAELGHPELAVFRYRFKKRAYRGQATTAGLRKVVKDSGVWGPPWADIARR